MKEYREYKLKFDERNLVLLECDYKDVDEVTDEVDLLISDNTANVLLKKQIASVYKINILNYEEILFKIKKQLELKTKADVLKLIMKRDKIVIDFILNNCDYEELSNIIAALAVFSDSCSYKKQEMLLVIDSELFEQFKSISVHQLFKLFSQEDFDDKAYCFKPHFYFLRKAFLSVEKHF